MADTMTIREGSAVGAPSISEIDILWVTAGLGCDGDTIAMTAATQPSIEDIVRGGIPWIPKVNFHNPFLAIENGDEFLRPFHLGAEGKLAPFILVVEGSIPNENNKKEGYWASMGTDQKTGQPITTCEWIDRRELARLTAVSTRWKETQPGVWGFPTIWGGSGNRLRIFRLCACRDARCSRITSWRRCSIFYIWPRGELR